MFRTIAFHSARHSWKKRIVAQTLSNVSVATTAASRPLYTATASSSGTLTTAASSSRVALWVIATTSLAAMIHQSNEYKNNGGTASSIVTTYNHCQVPCGIFDDPAIVKEIQQACVTIRKAMSESTKLTSNLQDMNQLVRWIQTKEDHANKIIHSMSDYCLCQRVKRINFSSEQEYLQALKIHHTVMQMAMKTKQTMNLKACDDLEHAVSDWAKLYTTSEQ